MAEEPRNTWLMVIGDPKGARFILQENRTAFTRPRPKGGVPSVGETLLMYMAGRVLHAPRHPGLVFGQATVTRGVELLDKPFSLAGRRFYSDMEIKISKLAPLDHGVALRDHIENISIFPSTSGWSARLRQSLIRLPQRDVDYLMTDLGPSLRNADSVLPAYVDALTKVINRRGRTSARVKK